MNKTYKRRKGRRKRNNASKREKNSEKLKTKKKKRKILLKNINTETFINVFIEVKASFNVWDDFFKLKD